MKHSEGPTRAGVCAIHKRFTDAPVELLKRPETPTPASEAQKGGAK